MLPKPSALAGVNLQAPEVVYQLSLQQKVMQGGQVEAKEKKSEPFSCNLCTNCCSLLSLAPARSQSQRICWISDSSPFVVNALVAGTSSGLPQPQDKAPGVIC